MSQFPPPYSQPKYPLDYRPSGGPPDLLAPARRASIMMIVLGILTLVLGACMGIISFVVPRDVVHKAFEDQQAATHGQVLPPGVSIDTMLLAIAVFSVVLLAAGLILIPLGILVRRANKVPTVFAVILCGLAVLYLGYSELNTILFVLSGNSLALLSAFFGMVPLVMFGLTVSWLMKVLRTLPQIEAARQQWESQYASSQQQQQLYNQGAYGGSQSAIPQQYYSQPTPGAPPAAQPPIGYGAMPKPVAPPPREPPLPPDQRKPE